MPSFYHAIVLTGRDIGCLVPADTLPQRNKLMTEETVLFDELMLAITSTEAEELAVLALSQNRFVRARIAGNRHISPLNLEQLLADTDRGVVLWALGNRSLTRWQYNYVFDLFSGIAYEPLIHPALAGHALATLKQLQLLLQREKWDINLAVVNNFRGRDRKKHLKLIAHLVPPPDKADSGETIWDEVERRANFLTHGTRWGTRD